MLSPLEVKKYEFKRAFRGYDIEEVRSFLETIAAELERLNEVNNKQSEELGRIKTEVSTFKRIEQNMKDALVNAQDALRAAREDSKREADILKREAKLEAENIFREAYNRSDQIRREIDELESRRDSFVRKWRSILNAELEMLQLLEEVGEDQKKQSATERKTEERAPDEHENQSETEITSEPIDEK